MKTTNIVIDEKEQEIILQALEELQAKHLRHSKNLGYDDVQQIYRKMAVEVGNLKNKIATGQTNIKT